MHAQRALEHEGGRSAGDASPGVRLGADRQRATGHERQRGHECEHEPDGDLRPRSTAG